VLSKSRIRFNYIYIQGIEFVQQCNQRNEDAVKLQKAYRMQRLQFHDNNDARQSMNIINLQNWYVTMKNSTFSYYLFYNIGL